ncbi:MAG: hypothetical protein IT208_13505 [Chthonomonadales bacterium]|nr:hypothetical protein [Chthonomonadales bacterium]
MHRSSRIVPLALARLLVGALPLCLLAVATSRANGPAGRATRYYAHSAVLDRHGVVAPWYRGLNGQVDWRVRIAAETMKRYPWTKPGEAPAPAPAYVYNGTWSVAADGAITVPKLSDWDNGDWGQRAAYILSALVDYYRYSGDPAAIAHASIAADTLLRVGLTPASHPWPRFPVSVPTRGRPYATADPRGMMQIDIAAEMGIALLRAHQMAPNARWLAAARHWADLMAAHSRPTPGRSPWNRYANPADVPWEDHQTGGVVFVAAFLDEVIRTGHTGRSGAIARARDAARAYLRDVLLPRWVDNDTWGRNYWDWPDPVQAENVTEFAARYLIEHPREFPGWRADARNLLTLFLNHTSVAEESGGGVFSGAWAYPESSGCCGRSLWYGPLELAPVYAQYAAATGSEWAREMARRQGILATYDAHETGVVEDGIDGGAVVAGGWFKIAHPMALKHALGLLAWLPAELGANRENHIVRSSAVVRDVRYAPGAVRFRTFDAPRPTVTVLRLAFAPSRVVAGGRRLRTGGGSSGYRLRALPNGDWIVTVRHDGHPNVVVEGADPQRSVRGATWSGPWRVGRGARAASASGATLTARFRGTQVRVLGDVGPDGGLAEVEIDGVRQPAPIDAWCPSRRSGQVLAYRNGLAPGTHTLRVAVRGAGNPLSAGAVVRIAAVTASSATGSAGFGAGGGPTGAQGVVFGRAARTDYVDTDGDRWRPATEWTVRAGTLADSVATAWWTRPRRIAIAGTRDPELYRYGAHAPRLTHHFTVGPGTYHLRLKLCETRQTPSGTRALTVRVNGATAAERVDIAATAGGLNRAVDLVFDRIRPVAGVIAVELSCEGGEAIVQAMEIAPGAGGAGARPVVAAGPPAPEDGNLLRDPGFEVAVGGQAGALGARWVGPAWTYVLAGPSRSYIWAESAYAAHPAWGLPEVREGREALRTHTDGHGHTIVYQEVAVTPGARYRASVWVRGADLHGRGFGADAGDSAGLWVQEIDAAGSVTGSHGKRAITRAGPYHLLEVAFTAAPATRRVRFVLDTVIACRYDEGHVTYDACTLRREPSG